MHGPLLILGGRNDEVEIPHFGFLGWIGGYGISGVGERELGLFEVECLVDGL